MPRRKCTRAGPLRRRAGLALVEYAVLIALLVVAAISSFRGLFATTNGRVIDYGDCIAAAADTRPR